MIHFFLFAFISLGLVNHQAFSLEEAPINWQKFKGDEYWRRLLHYQPSVMGVLLRGQTEQGQADGPEFYYSTEGKWNLAKEAEASWQAFNRPYTGDPNLHPQCRFPERYRYLKEQLKTSSSYNKDLIKDVRCPDFETWINDLDPIGVALVYAANYPNNPGSAMGHTFVRIISRKTSRLQRGGSDEDFKHLDLLDYSISYAAVTETNTGLTFAINGLTGGFLGQFSMQPYYMKVREYSEGEGRDLWEYELNVDEASMRRMMAHFWELSKNTFFYYYFIDENCSFHLLSLLDVARPDWDLEREFTWYTVPFETIKVVAQIPGALKEMKYRPSLPHRSHHVIKQLNSTEQADFRLLVNGNTDPELWQRYQSNQLFLEALAQYILYQKIENDLHFRTGHEELYRKALISRAKLGKRETNLKAIETPKYNRPDKGHGTSMVMLSASELGGHSAQQFSFRPALHDLLNRDAGFATNSRLDVLHTKFIRQNEKIKLREILFLDTISLLPWTTYERPSSWGLHTSYGRPMDYGATNMKTWQIRPSYGASWLWSDVSKSTFYCLFNWNLEYGSKLTNKWRTGPGLLLGSLWRFNEWGKLELKGELITHLKYQNEGHLNFLYGATYAHHLRPEWDLRLGAWRFWRGDRILTNYSEYSIGLAHTF